MLIRWIIILLGVYVLFRLLKRTFTSSRIPERKPPREIQDEMVQDPICQVYLPKRLAKELNSSNGVHYYFCSTQCLEKFIQEAKDRSATK